MDAERLAVSAKPIGIILLPTVTPTNAPTSLLKYWTEITWTSGLGLVRHGLHESVVDT